MQASRLRIRAVVMSVSVFSILAACSQFSLYDEFQALSLPVSQTESASSNGPGTPSDGASDESNNSVDNSSTSEDSSSSVPSDDSSEEIVTPLSIEPEVSGTLVNGIVYYTVAGGRSPYTFSVLPGGPGGVINSTTGVYAAPVTPGNETIQVMDADGQFLNATITVVAAPSLTIRETSLQVNTDDSYTFTAVGGVAPYHFSIVGTGGSITSEGTFTAPSVATATTTIQVNDNVGNIATATVTTVASGGGGTLALSPATVSIFDNDTLYVVASGGSPPYVSTSTSKGIASAIDPTTHTGTYNADGSLGNNTESVTDSTSAVATASIKVLPAPPSSLVATATSSSEIGLSWTNNTTNNNGGINIYRAVGNGAFTLVTNVASATTSYQDTSLTTATVYTYKLASVRNGPGGPFLGYSDYAVATTQ